MTVKVFISHSSVDTWIARQIGRHIDMVGAETFFDEADFAAGDNFVERILAAEPLCSELLVLLTPWAIRSSWVLFEISCFRHSRKRIVAVTHGLTNEEVLGDPYVGVLLDRQVIVDINRLDTYFRDLAGRVTVAAEGGSNG
jgi:hypothetical protein